MKNSPLAHRMAILLFSVSLLCLPACNNDEKQTTETTTSDSTNTTNPDSAKTIKNAEAILSSVYPDTAVSGTVSFTDQGNGKVKMTLSITVPSKAGKSVALHIHEHGDCGDTAKSAHGHWNPTGSNHGKWGSDNFHSGDIGNVDLNSEGKGQLELESDRWTLGGDSKTDILGKSIILHGGKDDYTSQPAGNSGARIGCGVINKKN